jgi:hypothetical protein
MPGTIDIGAAVVHSIGVKGAGYACTLFLVALMMPLAGNAEVPFPPEVHGWTLALADETYTPENLYRYIDGASELYISYGFVALLARQYVKAGQPEIVVDFFDMGTAANAFGIFAHSQEKPDHEIGQDSEYLDGLLRFWKGRFYVSLLCLRETPETKAALLALGRSLAAAIPENGARPPLLAVLPSPGLIVASIRFFCHPAWQNTYTFISDTNILGIGPGCQAVLAKYEQGSVRPVVLLVLYPDADAASRALANLGRAFHLPAGTNGAVELNEREYFAAAVERRIVAAVWHGGGAAPCIQLLAAVREKIAVFEK